MNKEKSEKNNWVANEAREGSELNCERLYAMLRDLAQSCIQQGSLSRARDIAEFYFSGKSFGFSVEKQEEIFGKGAISVQRLYSNPNEKTVQACAKAEQRDSGKEEPGLGWISGAEWAGLSAASKQVIQSQYFCIL